MLVAEFNIRIRLLSISKSPFYNSIITSIHWNKFIERESGHLYSEPIL